MSNYGQPGSEFVLPDNIYDLLEASLLPAHELNAARRNTEKYFVQGYPDLFVRLNRGEEVENIIKGLRAAHELREYGLDVLPAQVVEHDGEPYVVTLKVSGSPLPEILSGSQLLVQPERVDEVWAMLATSLPSIRQSGKLAPTEVYLPEQFMLGTIAGIPEPRIWLVDLPEYTVDLTRDSSYLEEILCLSNGVIGAETAAGNKMPISREILQRLIAGAEDSGYPGILARATAFVLENSVTIWPSDDDKLDELRTGSM